MLLSTVENLLNRGLPRSPRARQLCAELTGHSIIVSMPGITRLRLSCVSDSISIISDAAGTAEAEIIGGALALLQLAGSAPEAAIQRGDVQIRGDTDLAQKFRELAMLLRPDIEEELSLAIGDVPAHQIGRFARSVLDWGKRAADTTLRNVSEFLAHERGDLVSRPEGNQFLKGVDVAREDVDRLEARFELLRSRVEATQSKRGS